MPSHISGAELLPFYCCVIGLGAGWCVRADKLTWFRISAGQSARIITVLSPVRVRAEPPDYFAREVVTDMARLNQTMRKLQTAIVNAGQVVKINTHQFYSEEQGRMIT